MLIDWSSTRAERPLPGRLQSQRVLCNRGWHRQSFREGVASVSDFPNDCRCAQHKRQIPKNRREKTSWAAPTDTCPSSAKSMAKGFSDKCRCHPRLEVGIVARLSESWFSTRRVERQSSHQLPLWHWSAKLPEPSRPACCQYGRLPILADSQGDLEITRKTILHNNLHHKIIRRNSWHDLCFLTPHTLNHAPNQANYKQETPLWLQAKKSSAST